MKHHINHIIRKKRCKPPLKINIYKAVIKVKNPKKTPAAFGIISI